MVTKARAKTNGSEKPAPLVQRTTVIQVEVIVKVAEVNGAGDIGEIQVLPVTLSGQQWNNGWGTDASRRFIRDALKMIRERQAQQG